MKDSLFKQNYHWTEKAKQYYSRDLILRLNQHLSSKQIQIILGIRRSGKSSILRILINSFIFKGALKEEILYINFDEPIFMSFYDKPEAIDSIITQAELLTGHKIKYLFLDEIQNIVSWEKWVKSSYDNEIFTKIFITGSNSQLLENQYIERLSGRYFQYYCLPFSFKELLIIKQISFSSTLNILNSQLEIITLFNDYMHFGGFPETVASEVKMDLLLNYYEAIIFKDCIALNKIRNSKLLKNLAFYLISNITSLYSYNSLAKVLNSNENTIREYVQFLLNSFLFYEINKFDYSLTEQIKTHKKIYCIDTGIINAVSFQFSENKGKLLENIVFIALKRAQKEIYYHSKNKECDFIIKENFKIVQAIQVTYSINKPETRKREIDGLMEALNTYNLFEGLILTENEEEIIEIKDKKIIIQPTWKWLLNL